VDLYGWGIGPGLGSSFNQPEPQMFQYPSNDLLIFNETDNAHFPLASGAGKGIYLIKFDITNFEPQVKCKVIAVIAKIRVLHKRGEGVNP
jgi:hypothetical protein